ncbi:MAG TPA: S46 family peptidase, partial [Myxococcota bacterium]|nr:S46 family peptidase [Myxococcota bacterium]
RLVMAPPSTVGNYGDQVDNWHWPRHAGDFAFLRAYAGPDGKPAAYAQENQPWKPKNYLPVAAAAPGDGAFVAVLGYPGRTFRWKTAAELDFAVGTEMPQRVAELDHVEQQLVRDYTETPALKLILSPWRSGVANRLNKLRGMVEALRRPGLLEGRREMEQAIRRKMADNAASKQALDNLDRLQTATEQRWAGDFAVEMVETSSRLLSLANQLDERALQRVKPDTLRLLGYQERDESRFLSSLETFSRRVAPDTDRKLLARYLGRMMALPEGEGIVELRRWVLAQGGLEPALDRLYAAPILMEATQRQRISTLTPAQLAAEKDPFLQVAVALRDWRERSRREDKLRSGEANRWRPQRAAALHALFPRLAYPDANSTLRVTFGRIQGYEPRDGVAYTSHTTLAGLVAKAGPAPFDAPPLLVEKAKQNPTLPVDFLSDLDITGGNSGSATVDAEGRLVGLAFDGTWESIASDWIFDGRINRTIHVDIGYVRWYLAEVAGAQALLAELGP